MTGLSHRLTKLEDTGVGQQGGRGVAGTGCVFYIFFIIFFIQVRGNEGGSKLAWLATWWDGLLVPGELWEGQLSCKALLV